MQRRDFLSLWVLSSAVWAFEARADAPELAVIVHPKGPIHAVDFEVLHAIFTTRKRSWSDGSKLIALNFPPRSPLRVTFDRAVLRMEPDEVGRYWIDRKVRGGNPPPKHVSSVATMRGVVAKLEGAIGYLSADDVTDAVRVVAWIKAGKVIVL